MKRSIRELIKMMERNGYTYIVCEYFNLNNRLTEVIYVTEQISKIGLDKHSNVISPKEWDTSFFIGCGINHCIDIVGLKEYEKNISDMMNRTHIEMS